MKIIHVYDCVADNARGLFPKHAVRGDLFEVMKQLEEGYQLYSHADFVAAGFMNIITEENA